MSLRIDRPTFLALTFGMAGSPLGCNTGPGPAVAANVVDIPPQPAQPRPSTTAAAPATGETAKAPSPDEVAEADEDGGEGLVMADDEGQGCGWVDPAAVPSPPASCNDDLGPVPSCAALKSCPGFAFPRTECDTYRRLYKPKVAQRAIDCLVKLSAKQLCDDACNTYRCADRALKGACPDASAVAACRSITQKCPSTNGTDCQQYLAGLNPAGRAKMVSCMTAACGASLYSCAEGL